MEKPPPLKKKKQDKGQKQKQKAPAGAQNQEVEARNYVCLLLPQNSLKGGGGIGGKQRQ
jgi:hypothetical protein